MKTGTTIEAIENDYWAAPEYDSHLVKEVHRLRKKNINDFDVEDLRIMIGQNVALDILIPVAIEKLKENILSEGNMYEGDLLNSVLFSNKKYWDEHHDQKQEIITLFQKNLALFSDNRHLTKAYADFNNVSPLGG